MSRRFPLLVGCVIATLAATTASQAARPTKRLSDEARGEQLYDRHCIQCHGENGVGDGPLTPSLVKPVPDLREILVEANRERFVPVVMDGRGAMPAYRNSFDRFDAERVMRHMERIAIPGYQRPSTVKPTVPTPEAPTVVTPPAAPLAPALPPPPPPKAAQP